jgi:hypothetical protein
MRQRSAICKGGSLQVAGQLAKDREEKSNM